MVLPCLCWLFRWVVSTFCCSNHAINTPFSIFVSVLSYISFVSPQERGCAPLQSASVWPMYSVLPCFVSLVSGILMYNMYKQGLIKSYFDGKSYKELQSMNLSLVYIVYTCHSWYLLLYSVLVASSLSVLNALKYLWVIARLLHSHNILATRIMATHGLLGEFYLTIGDWKSYAERAKQ